MRAVVDVIDRRRDVVRALIGLVGCHRVMIDGGVLRTLADPGH
jgi:hypothetical protein